MLFMKSPQRTAIDEVFKQIREYCRQRDSGIGGSWTQEPYKFDFFNIFYNAYYNGHCGGRGWHRLNRAYKRGKKQSEPATFVVTGDLIRAHLEGYWLNGKAPTRRTKRMIEDLTQWWDDWTYAWECHPVGIPRQYFRRQRKSSVARTTAAVVRLAKP